MVWDISKMFALFSAKVRTNLRNDAYRILSYYCNNRLTHNL